MDILELDIETFSTVDLKKANVYAYTEDPAFEVLMCGWSLNDSPVEVWEGEGYIGEISGLWDPDVKKVAHNAPFERVCFSRMRGMPVGQYLPPEDWFDTAAVSALQGLPRSLDAVAKAVGAPPKDSAGTALINLFCMPRAPRRGAPPRRIFPHEQPEKWAQFLDYCRQDVETLQAVRAKIGGWPSAFERDLWYADQRVNDRGIKVDLDLARAAVRVAEENDARLEREVIEITGVENPGSTQQLGAWCESVGRPMANWQKETVKQALEDSTLSDDVRRVLELRQELALVSANKYAAMLRSVSVDGRLRGQFMYHAAHTGRWSSRGVQLHNLAKKGFTVYDEALDDEVTDWAKIQDVIIGLICGGDASPDELKKMVRPTFVSPSADPRDPGDSPFAISDFSAIEARVLAWLAGEEWVLQAFRESRDLYVETAERMGGGMGRPEGKIAVLAAGYQGSVGSFRNMGYGGRLCPLDVPRPKTAPKDDRPLEARRADLERSLSVLDGTEHTASAVAAYVAKALRLKVPPEDFEAALLGHVRERERDPNHKCNTEIKAIVDAWRDANDNIRQFWYEIERKFWTGGTVGAGQVTIEVRGGRRLVHLPSGRVLVYHGVHKQQVKTEDEETGEVKAKRQITYRHVQGYQEKTYGGRLTENVTQAVARDLLADAMLRLDAAGYFVVAHVHDEAVSESHDIEGITAIMRTPPDWAEGLPMDASGDLVPRYTK